MFTLAIHSLNKNKVRSLFYFLTFVLTTVFIFSFFIITFHPATDIHLGKDDTTMVTLITTLVMVVAMVCVFLTNDFYVTNKKEEISILLMSGASVYQIGRYLFMQSSILMLAAIPLGFFIGYVLLPWLTMVFAGMMQTGTSLYITKEAITATLVIVIFEVLWCTYLNIGYCYRNSVQKLQSVQIDWEAHGMTLKKIKPVFWILLYFCPLPFILYPKEIIDNNVLISCGLAGMYGMIKHILPYAMSTFMREKGSQHKEAYIAFGFVRYNLQRMMFLVLTLLFSSILLMACMVYHLDMPMILILTLVSYASIMILMSMTMVAKVGIDLRKRQKSYQHLLYLGYIKKELKRIMRMEMLLFYGILVSVPMVYQIAILINLVMAQEITLLLGGSMVIVQIVPILISTIISIRMYYYMLSK